MTLMEEPPHEIHTDGLILNCTCGWAQVATDPVFVEPLKFRHEIINGFHKKDFPLA